MSRDSYQSRSWRQLVACSSGTPIVGLGLVILLWILPTISTQVSTRPYTWASLCLILLSTYAILDLANRFSIIRIRSRLVTGIYVLSLCIFPSLLHDVTTLVVVLCMLVSYRSLFGTYQSSHIVMHILHCFIALGIAIYLYPPLILLTPVYYISMLTQFRVFTLRSFAASILGLLLPACYISLYHLMNGTLSIWYKGLKSLSIDWHLPTYLTLSLGQVIITSFLLLLSLLSLLHLFRTAYNDKIQTRLILYFIAIQDISIMSLYLLLPQYADLWIALMVLNASPLIAHYFTLAKGRSADLVFILTTLVWFIILLLPLWIPLSLSLSNMAI